jgi:histidinol-phosphate aminotransferase
VNVPLAKPAVEALADYAPRELSDDGVVVRAHRNEAALPPPEHVIAALRSIDADALRCYPVALQRRAIAALAVRLGVEAQCVVFGNGADDVLGAIAGAFLRAGDLALTVAPTFGTYARAVTVAGGELRTLRYARRWTLDADALIALAGTEAKLVILGHPNNPTGEPLAAEDLARIAGALPGALIVVDEVYLAFSGRSFVRVAQGFDNVAIVGSLAGMRIGYAVAPPDIAAAIRRAMPPFPLGAPALLAAEAYAGGGAATAAYDRALAEQVVCSLDALAGTLRPRARALWRGLSNFFLADFGDDASEIEERLQRAGIAVRSFTDPDLAGCLRICALDDRDTALVIEAINA